MSTSKDEAEFDNIIKLIYKSAREENLTDFKDSALRAAQRIVGFDSGFWAEGHMKVSARSFHHTYAFNQSPDFLTNYFANVDMDFFAEMVVASPAQEAVLAVPDEESQRRYWQTEIYLSHAKKFGIEHAISIWHENPRSGLAQIVAAYRQDPKHFFSRHDCEVWERITPHLINAAHHNRLCNLHATGASVAQTNQEGFILVCSDSFLDLLSKGWPEWRPSKLPIPTPSTQEPYVCRSPNGESALVMTPRGDTWEACAVDTLDFRLLTDAEWKVAQVSAKQDSVEQIANELGLKVRTVYNHLQKINKKLKTRSRHNLTALWLNMLGRQGPRKKKDD